MIKVQIIADTHGRFIPISKNVDGYFLLGDNSGSWIWDIQEQTLNGKFAVSVLGNHDDPAFSQWYPFLQFPEVTQINDYTIGCISGCLKYGYEDYIGFTEQKYKEYINSLPKCDIILSHAAPWGTVIDTDYVHSGIIALKEKILREQPKYCFYGHLHENKVAYIGKTKTIGVFGSQIIEI